MFRGAQEKLSTTRRARRVTPSTMSSNAKPGAEMSAHRKKSEQPATVAIQPETQSAIPGLSDDVVIVEILGRIKDPTDLAVLRAVSRAMRDAVAATGHQVKETTWEDAAGLGYLSTLKHLHRQGRLKLSQVEDTQKVLQQEAAAKGQLEVLQWLHANGCPWNRSTCSGAAGGGHLKAMQWLIANGCPWNADTCAWAAKGGHLEVLQWARENGCPWDNLTCCWAIQYGHIELLNWAVANGCPQNIF